MDPSHWSHGYIGAVAGMDTVDLDLLFLGLCIGDLGFGTVRKTPVDLELYNMYIWSCKDKTLEIRTVYLVL